YFLGGPVKVGLNPVAADRMYLFLLEPQPEPLWRPEDSQHAVLKELLRGYGGVLQEIRDGLDADADIICRPLETVFLGADWARGRRAPGRAGRSASSCRWRPAARRTSSRGCSVNGWRARSDSRW
ncbi:MAG: hypothetical protein ACK5PI_00435, partial [Acetobacteraceae bacterium]